MPIAFVIFMAVWMPFVCAGMFLLGAYVLYCKNSGANPLRDSGFYIPRIFNDPPERQTKQDEVRGFFE